MEKLITRPIIPITGTYADAFFYTLVFVLMGAAALFFYCARSPESEKWRYLVRILSTFVFVILIFYCMCLLRTTVYGIAQIGWNDIFAFANLFLFVIIAGFTLLMGRFFCGWVCPFGFFQEITSRGSSLLKTKKLKFMWWAVTALAAIWYFVVFLTPGTDFIAENVMAFWAAGLIIIVFFLLVKPDLEVPLLKIRVLSVIFYILASGLFSFFSELWCPIYGGEVDYAATFGFFVVLLLSPVISLVWCRYLCPTGIFLSFLSRFSFLGIKARHHIPQKQVREKICFVGALGKDSIDSSRCLHCGRCIRFSNNTLTTRSEKR